MEVFTINHLNFAYPEQEKNAISDLTLSVRPGEFLVLCGPSGCGKSTLLRQLKTVLAPHGRRSGEILFDGRNLDSLDQREQAETIGFVQQSPENQIATDKVWHELAFGLESLGCDTPTIRRRVAEMASFFGIQTWFYKPVTELSGGQKQLLNLASVMVLQPKVLILDEPTSQLDPIAASDFLATLGKINRELGTTILLTEHRLEEAFSFASRVAVMDGGKLLCTGTPAEVGAELKSSGNAMFLAMPAAMRIWAASDSKATCPISVCDGRNWLLDYAKTHELRPVPEEKKNTPNGETVVSARELWFKYDKDLPDVVKGLSLELHKGEFLALLGGNGTGKTTTLKLLASLKKPYRGELNITGSVGMLPQNPQTLFVKATVREDLLEFIPKSERKPERLAQVVSLCKLAELLDIDLKNAGKPEMANLPDKLRAYGAEKAAAECGVGVPTLQDIVKELVKPGRDPRDELPAPILRTDVLELKDLKPGMELTGTVRNVIDFGAFVDIGVHQDGLVHISQVCNKFIKHPSEAVAVGDVVKVVVLDVDEKKHRISLSMKQVPEE